MKYENLFKIHIPEPCHEDWNKMTPNEQGAFCSSCAKTVIDFSDKTPEEVDAILSENADKKMCGRFRISQLEEGQKLKNEIPKIQFPGYLFPITNSPFKAYMLALIAAVSITVAGCSNSDGTGTGEKNDKIEHTTGANEIKPDTNNINKNESDTSGILLNTNSRIQGGYSIKPNKDPGCKIDPLKEVKLLGTPVMKKDTLETTDTTTTYKNRDNYTKMGIMVKTKDTKENK